MAGILAAEQIVASAFERLFSRWMPRARKAVFANGEQPDPLAVFTVAPEYTREAAHIADDVIARTYRQAYVRVYTSAGSEPIRTLDFNGHGREQDYLTTARNRLVNVPDQVYAIVKERVATATLEGWDLPHLAAEIDQVLAVHDQSRWTNRAMTIARTEAVGAYNAGTYAGFTDLAEQLGGDWEKAWLCTHDQRTRPTHREADMQRVPLGQLFTVGAAYGLYPGHHALPAEEVINCRCSMLLLRPGERPDLSNRHLKKAAA